MPYITNIINMGDVKIVEYFKKHLEENNFSYLGHMKRSLVFSCQSFKAFLIFLIHAFLPFIFIEDGSKIIKNLNSYFCEECEK